MKKILILTIVIGLISLLAGCSNLLGNEKQDIKANESNKTQYADENAITIQTIIVHKRVDSENKYENLIEINDDELLSKVNDLLDSIEWEIAKVEMVRPPDYKFLLKYKNTNSPFYMVWISPNNDKLEIVIDSESKYVQLDQAKSSVLFEMLTDSKLSDMK